VVSRRSGHQGGSHEPSILMVDVSELQGKPGVQEHIEGSADVPEGFSTVLIGIDADHQLDLQMRLESVHEGVLVTGTASAEVTGQCGRCLDQVRFPISVDVMQLFSWPGQSASGADGDDDEDRTVGPDLNIDLEPVLRDLMVSALPFQPVCREDCPGLCSQCGFRLEEDPEHEHEQLDPRWSALEGLAKDLEGPPPSHPTP
jgi:uncharacterized protein